MSIVIDKEFQSLIPALSPEEFKQLEENCVREGIRDALIVWKQPDGNDILIDGHNRWNISVRHGGIPFQIKQKEFPDRESAETWIIRNQLGRRNIDKWVRYDLAKQLEEIEAKQAKERQGARTDINIPPMLAESRGDTRDKMAKMVGVSHGTYDKMKTIDEKATPETKQLVREGKLSINQAFNSVHPKRPGPVKQAKAEHAEFQEKKRESVVSFKDAQIDKINQEIIENDLYQTVLKLLANVEKFGMQYKTTELEKMFKSLKSDELDDIRNRCVACKSIILAIQIATTGLHDH